MNIVAKIFERCDPHAVALIRGERTITFGELRAEVATAEAALRGAGAFVGPRVGLSCPNGIDYVVLALAIVKSGCCFVPIASELAAPEVDEIVTRTGLASVVLGGGAQWRGVAEPRACSHGAVVALGAEVEFDEAAFAALNVAFVRFSSGTTGRSKGVVLSHASLLERVTAANRGLRIGPEDRVVWMLPMAHHFAVSIILYLLHGATTVLAESHLAPEVLAEARRHGGTVIYGSPFHYAMLAAEASGDPWPTLRLAVSTAAALSRATAEAFDARFGVPLTQGLGIIEVGLPLLNLDAAREQPTAVGRPQPGFEAEVRGAAGGVGELFLRGPGMFDAYLSPWRSRDEVLEEGWFRTGDLATMDACGRVTLCGRSHSVINVAGMKVFPEEVEAVLDAHPLVLESRVSGRAHPQVGAMPVAELVLRNAAQRPKIPSLVSHCRAALAGYKVPLDFRFVEALPRTASGKIKRA